MSSVRTITIAKTAPLVRRRMVTSGCGVWVGAIAWGVGRCGRRGSVKLRRLRSWKTMLRRSLRRRPSRWRELGAERSKICGSDSGSSTSSKVVRFDSTHYQFGCFPSLFQGSTALNSREQPCYGDLKLQQIPTSECSDGTVACTVHSITSGRASLMSVA